MILSNTEILKGIKLGSFNIDPLAGDDPERPPFNTSAIDLRLGHKLERLEEAPAAIDLRKPGIARFLNAHSKAIEIS